MHTLKGHLGPVWSVDFSGDDTILASCGSDTLIKLWDLRKGQDLAVLHNLRGHKDCICSVKFSPDSSKIVSGSDDKTLRVWDVQTGKLLKTFRIEDRD
jgi:WD40 repeat protein